MKKFCFFGIAALFIACNNDKITEVLNVSQFYAVRVDPQAITLAQGGTQTLTVTAFDANCTGANCNPLAPGNPISVNGISTFRSTDTTVATVDPNGVVTAKAKAGTANIIGALQNIPGGTSVPSVTLADTTPVTVLAAGATPPRSWAQAQINAVVAAGIMGTDPQAFRPDDPLTRPTSTD